MIIDAHNHIGSKKGTSLSAEELLEMMGASGIEKGIVFSFSEQIDNEYIIDSVKKYPEKLYGFVTINPWLTTSEAELEENFKKREIYGLKLQPVKHGYSLDNHMLLDPLFKLCEQYYKPVLIFGGASVNTSPNMFADIAKSFPLVNLIMAHGGQMYETKSAIAVAKKNKNIYIETSQMFAMRIETLLSEHLEDQIIFGSDTPYGNSELEVEKIRLIVEKALIREKIFSGNVQKLLGEVK